MNDKIEEADSFDQTVSLIQGMRRLDEQIANIQKSQEELREDLNVAWAVAEVPEKKVKEAQAKLEAAYKPWDEADEDDVDLVAKLTVIVRAAEDAVDEAEDESDYRWVDELEGALQIGLG